MLQCAPGHSRALRSTQEHSRGGGVCSLALIALIAWEHSRANGSLLSVFVTLFHLPDICILTMSKPNFTVLSGCWKGVPTPKEHVHVPSSSTIETFMLHKNLHHGNTIQNFNISSLILMKVGMPILKPCLDHAKWCSCSRDIPFFILHAVGK